MTEAGDFPYPIEARGSKSGSLTLSLSSESGNPERGACGEVWIPRWSGRDSDVSAPGMGNSNH
jgi:hypothetical protein